MYGTGVQDFGSDLDGVDGVDDIDRKDVKTAVRAACDRNNLVVSIVSFVVLLFSKVAFSHGFDRTPLMTALLRTGLVGGRQL